MTYLDYAEVTVNRAYLTGALEEAFKAVEEEWYVLTPNAVTFDEGGWIDFISEVSEELKDEVICDVIFETPDNGDISRTVTLKKAEELMSQVDNLDSGLDAYFLAEYLDELAELPTATCGYDLIYLNHTPSESQSWNAGYSIVNSDNFELPEGWFMDWVDLEALGRDHLEYYDQTTNWAYRER